MFQICPQVSQRQYVDASVFSEVFAIFAEPQKGQTTGFGSTASGVLDLIWLG
jgi:hypothetical protein